MVKQLAVNSVLFYLRYFAKKAIAKHNPTVIGIGGSIGKSSVREILYAILKDHFPTKEVSGNSETGVPLGILGIKPEGYGKKDWVSMLKRATFGTEYIKGIKYLIVEMGIDDPYPPKNMEYLLTIIKPTIAISLNVAPVGMIPAHLMQFEKVLREARYKNIPENEKQDVLLARMAEEETKIITQSECSVGIYNVDDVWVYAAMNNISGNTKVYTFGKEEKNTISFLDYKVDLKGTTFSFIYNHEKKEKFTVYIENYVLPKEYQETISAAILAALQTGLSIKQITQSLEKNFLLPKGRASIFKGINNTIILDSSYNASKASTFAFLDLVAKLKKETKRPVVFLFGDMRELGSASGQEHVDVAIKTVGIIDYLYCVGVQTKEFVMTQFQTVNETTTPKEVRWFLRSQLAGEYLKEHLPKNALVLVKGSQNTIFLEEAIKDILADKKDIKHLCRQEVYWKK